MRYYINEYITNHNCFISHVKLTLLGDYDLNKDVVSQKNVDKFEFLFKISVTMKN